MIKNLFFDFALAWFLSFEETDEEPENNWIFCLQSGFPNPKRGTLTTLRAFLRKEEGQDGAV